MAISLSDSWGKFLPTHILNDADMLPSHNEPFARTQPSEGYTHAPELTRFHEAIKIHAAAIFQIENVKSGSKGTGCLIGGNLLMTNNHVIASRELAEDCRARLWHVTEMIPDKEEYWTRGSKWFKFKPEGFFAHSPSHEMNGLPQPADAKHLDYTILELEDSSVLARLQPACLSIFHDQPSLAKNQPVWVIQYPDIKEKTTDLIGISTIATGSIRQIGEFTLHHDAPATKGSSGGAIIDMQGRLIALHHQGKPSPDPNGRPYRYGIIVNKIVQDLKRDNLKLKIQSLIQNQKYVLSKSPPPENDLQGNNQLHVAVKNGNTAEIKKLFKSGSIDRLAREMNDRKEKPVDLASGSIQQLLVDITGVYPKEAKFLPRLPTKLNYFFNDYDRLEKLQSLIEQTANQNSEGYSRIVVTGVDEEGKSMFLRKYSVSMHYHYERIICVPSSTKEEFYSCLVQIAKALMALDFGIKDRNKSDDDFEHSFHQAQLRLIESKKWPKAFFSSSNIAEDTPLTWDECKEGLINSFRGEGNRWLIIFHKFCGDNEILNEVMNFAETNRGHILIEAIDPFPFITPKTETVYFREFPYKFIGRKTGTEMLKQHGRATSVDGVYESSCGYYPWIASRVLSLIQYKSTIQLCSTQGPPGHLLEKFNDLQVFEKKLVSFITKIHPKAIAPDFFSLLGNEDLFTTLDAVVKLRSISFLVYDEQRSRFCTELVLRLLNNIQAPSTKQIRDRLLEIQDSVNCNNFKDLCQKNLTYLEQNGFLT